MPNETSRLLNEANRELHSFLARVAGLVQGRDNVRPDDLSRIRALLQSVAPVVSEAQRTASADPDLQVLLHEYAANLRAAQKALQQVLCVMLTRRARMDAEQSRLNQLQSWANAYRQTT